MAGLNRKNGVPRLSGSMYTGSPRFKAANLNGVPSATWVVVSKPFAWAYSLDDGITWSSVLTDSFTTDPKGGTWARTSAGDDEWIVGLGNTSNNTGVNVGQVPTGSWSRFNNAGEPGRKGNFCRTSDGDYHALMAYDDEDVCYSDSSPITYNDSSNWTKLSNLDLPTSDIESFSLGKANDGSDLFYVAGAEKAAFVPSLGGTWDQDSGTGMSGLFLRDIHYGDGYWVFVGQSNNIKYSNSTNNWNSATMDGETASEWNSIAYSKKQKLWVAVANGGYVGVSSGSVPSHFNVSKPIVGNLESVRCKGGTWIAGGINGKIIRSTDGKSWTEITIAGFDPKDIQVVLVDSLDNDSLDRG